MSEIRLKAPLSVADARALKLGDTVFLDGEIVATAGLPTHQRIVEYAKADKKLPVNLHGEALFHMGSYSRETNGKIEPLYVNPTTSTRFNACIPTIVRHYGVTALSGKGGLDAESVRAMQEKGCVYFSMIGGAAPLLTAGVKEVLEAGWDDFILHFRLTRFRIENLGPLTVAIDAHGRSIYDDLSKSVEARLPEIMARLNARRAAT